MNARRAGVLLPVFSLPPDDAGFSAAARAFIDWLVEAKFPVWQMLPIGPTGADGSPYWLRSDHATHAALADTSIDRETVSRATLAGWCERERHWLADYALFEALSAEHGGAPWQDWPAALRDREAAALTRARHRHSVAIERIAREQYLADRCWTEVRAYANSRGVALFGDLPIYVAPGSVETWVHRGQFQLDGAGRPLALAGVPPDYFAADGQLWGNPVYDWDAMAADGFAWWRARVRRALERFDLLRLDHFRGLAAYWRVPVGAATAREGEWRAAGGTALLRRLVDDARARLPGEPVPFVAEDLGIITPDVDALRQQFALPGMRVLQFAFDGSPDNPYLPHRHTRDSVVYTGTHDNDTTLGWYDSLDAAARAYVDYVLRTREGDMPGALVHAALASVADLAVVPVADLLGLGTEARINVPGTVSGNWRWRLPAGALTRAQAARFARANQVFGRALLR
ncbi:MAG: 4-alpha-glucanotransferase [Steroidobacteraceae bacterium]